MTLFGNNMDLNGFTSDVVAGGTQSGSFDTGDAANAVLDAAASAIPFGAMVKDFLDKMGLQQNIDNVLKYGFSSWGASSSPEQIQGEFNSIVLPYVQAELQKITGSNIISILERLTNELLANHYYHIALRDHHSNAKSTRLANDWAQKEYLKLSDEIFTGIQAEFSAKGIKISRSKVDIEERQAGFIAIIKGNAFFNDRDLDNYINKKYWKLEADTSKFENVTVDENGNVTTSGGGGLGLLAAAGFAIFKLMK